MDAIGGVPQGCRRQETRAIRDIPSRRFSHVSERDLASFGFVSAELESLPRLKDGLGANPEYKRFLARLREAREEAGLKQAEAARLFDQDQAWMSKVERGVRRLDVIELAKLARLYKKPARYFVPDFPPEE